MVQNTRNCGQKKQSKLSDKLENALQSMKFLKLWNYFRSLTARLALFILEISEGVQTILWQTVKTQMKCCKTCFAGGPMIAQYCVLAGY